MPLRPDTDTLTRRRGRRRRGILVLFLLAALAVVAMGAFRTGPAPSIAIDPSVRAIGRTTAIGVTVREPSRGIAGVHVEIVQGAATFQLADEKLTTPAPWNPLARGTVERTLRLEIGKNALPGLAEGEAKLRVVARPSPAWLRAGKAAEAEVSLPVRLVPPALSLLSTQHYVTQGGAEAVVYRVGATSVRDGIEVGDWFFPGYPLPGGAGDERFALFAAPYDLADGNAIRLLAADEVGNEARLPFVDRYSPLAPHEDEIRLEDAFLARVVPEIFAQTPSLVDRGSLLENYLEINRDLRRANAAELRQLATRTRPQFLWKAAFLALPGGQVMSSFADRRTYFYGGREVDRQDHLGFDLASVARADVPAANSGIVVLARYFGIYGNTVVIDHGYGLMSLYAHLSSIAVTEGAEVKRGQVLGKSGATGLAGGDHLHFTFLLQGLPVRPVEWWDAHWIRDRIGRKLGDALPFGG